MSEREELLRRAKLAQAKAALQRMESREEYAPVPGVVTPPLTETGEGLAGRTLPEAMARRADDVVRATASGATFGLADEIAAAAQTAVGDEDYASNLAAQRARDEAMDPKARLVGELAGALGTGAGLARQGVTFLRNAPRTLPSLAGRGAAEGAAYGAAHGFGHGEGAEGRIKEAAKGAALGAATGGTLGAVSRGIIGGAARPTTEALKQQAGRAYDKAEAAGVIVKSDSFRKAVDRMQETIAEAGVDKTLHQRVMAAFERLKEGAAQNQTLKGMEILRRVVRGAAKSTDEDERRIAMLLLDDFDDFVSGLKSSDVVAGPTKEAVSSLREARRLWHTVRKARTIEGLVEGARNRAGQFTGSGYENALRTEFRGLAQNARRMRQFNKTEQEFIRKVARGTPLGNALRWLGKLAPRGVVSTALSGGMGYGVGGPAGAAGILLAGEAGRAGATAATKANVTRVVNEILGPVTKGPVTISPQQAQLLRSAVLGGVEAQRQPGLMPMSRTTPAR